MIYEIGYTSDGTLTELCNTEIARAAIKELNLSGIAGGTDTFIWKKLDCCRGYYAMLHKRNHRPVNKNQRTIPLVYGIVMEESVASSILNKKENFYSVRELLMKVPYQHVIGLKKASPYKTLEKWIRDVFTGEKNYLSDWGNDREQEVVINKAILSTLVDGKTVYLENKPSFSTLLMLLEKYPDCIKKEISFSYPYGGTAAGVMDVNFGVDKMFDSTADGFPVGTSVNDRGLEDCSDDINRVAAELFYSAHIQKYNEFVKGMGLYKLIDTTKDINQWRVICRTCKQKESIEKFEAFIAKKREQISRILPCIENEGPTDEFLCLMNEIVKEEAYREIDVEGEMEEECDVTIYRERKKVSQYPITLECSMCLLIFVGALILSGMIHYNYFEINESHNIRLILDVTKRDAALLILIQMIFMSIWKIVKIISEYLFRKLQEKRKY